MTLPQFLIIGAMKAGTTTLFEDLRANPHVFMPGHKELESLCDEQVLTAAGRQRYASYFDEAGDEQVCGEASTAYSKRPTYEGVAQRAKKVLGADLKAIYIVREPVARIISHHDHFSSLGMMTTNIDEAVRSEPTMLDYSRYAMQVEPWLEALGPASVRIVRFESYVADRPGTIAELSRFLGVEPRTDLIEVDTVFNKSEGKPLLRGVWHAVKHNPVYMGIRSMIPTGMRDRVREKVLPKAKARTNLPAPQTIEWIQQQLRDDTERLQQLMGASQPLWDHDAVRAKYAG